MVSMRLDARKKSEQITVRLDEEVFQELEKYAKIDRRALGWMARELIEEGLAARKAKSKRKASRG